MWSLEALGYFAVWGTLGFTCSRLFGCSGIVGCFEGLRCSVVQQVVIFERNSSAVHSGQRPTANSLIPDMLLASTFVLRQEVNLPTERHTFVKPNNSLVGSTLIASPNVCRRKRLVAQMSAHLTATGIEKRCRPTVSQLTERTFLGPVPCSRTGSSVAS